MTRVDKLDDFGGCVRSDGKVYSLVLDFDSTRGEPDAMKSFNDSNGQRRLRREFQSCARIDGRATRSARNMDWGGFVQLKDVERGSRQRQIRITWNY